MYKNIGIDPVIHESSSISAKRKKVSLKKYTEYALNFFNENKIDPLTFNKEAFLNQKKDEQIAELRSTIISFFRQQEKKYNTNFEQIKLMLENIDYSVKVIKNKK